MEPARTGPVDRGRRDLLSDPGTLDIIRDGERRDLLCDPGRLDLVHDPGAHESFVLGVSLTGRLPDEIVLALETGRSGAFALRPAPRE